jgi:hypothetical protein
MTMRTRIARLFTIKTRTEAFLVTYAIAVGAIERGLHYMDQYGGYSGIILALACLGVPFIAGAKLIDSVKPQRVLRPVRIVAMRRRPAPRFVQSRPYPGPSRHAAPHEARRRD